MLSYNGTSYLEGILTRPDRILNVAESILRAHLDQFDTFVGRSVSGALALPLFGKHFNKNILLVRKRITGSIGARVSHSSYEYEGVLGESWVFLDDLIASGETFRETRCVVQGIGGSNLWGAYCYNEERFRNSANLIGSYGL
jgi:orotate phosphoribosyltransferase-like protein